MADTEKLKISAVIPAYNADKYIARSIDSVLSQTRPVDEIVVVDDGSTDNTAAVIKSYGGVSAARNTGIEAATGDWIAFLDADDEWLPKKIELQTENLRNHPDLVWTTGNYIECLCDENRRAEQYPERKIRKLLKNKDCFESYFVAWRNSLWGCSDVQMIRRDILIKAGLFPVGQKIAEDVDTWLRVAYLYPQVGFIPEPLAVYHFDNPQSGKQMHSNERFHADFIEKHFRLAEQAGMMNDFRPAAAFAMRRWIRGMLFSGRKSEIFSPAYRSLIYAVTTCPRATVFCLHCLSKVVRALKLRRRVTRRPPTMGR
jgi:glycosyltransferase involved in cell wall biosynthesis